MSRKGGEAAGLFEFAGDKGGSDHAWGAAGVLDSLLMGKGACS